MSRSSQIKAFIAKWQGKGKEKQDTHKFWEELVELVLEVEHGRDFLDFEKDAPVSVVHVEDGENVKWIDCYVKPSKCVIEQKSYGISLNKKTASYIDDKNEKHEIDAIQQAQLYYNRLNQSDQGRYFIACNFNEFVVVDNERKQNEPVRFELKDLQQNFRLLRRVLSGEKKLKESDALQDATAKTASEVVKQLYELIKSQYRSSELTFDVLHQINVFCVRIVFCLYADDDELFDNGQFRTFLEAFTAKKLEEKFRWLFHALNYEPEARAESLDKEIMAFPKVNGGLFQKEVAIPKISEAVRDFILKSSDNLFMPGKEKKQFHWSQISPTNFGCIFESTLDPHTRKKNGMHYTTPENIHKVIDPLFLDTLRDKLDSILAMPKDNRNEQKARSEALKGFQKEIASLKFLDPACGSGNFLTETFKSLRRLELEAIRELPYFGMDEAEIQTDDGKFLVSPCKVSIDQFYGIEINDFASQVALCALWISECQMTAEAEELFNVSIDRLPLRSNSNIVCADALTTDWNTVIKPKKLNYIIGNPPFEGSKELSDSQKKSVAVAMGDRNADGKPIWTNYGTMDFVCAWYAKAARCMSENKEIKTALVSTNSITQGEQVSLLWETLTKYYSIKIQFAYRSFVWESDSTDTAKVHCVIIGFKINRKRLVGCKIFCNDGTEIECEQINAYLLPAEQLFIDNRSKPLCQVPTIGIGNKPIDDSNYLFSKEQMETFVKQEPLSKDYFKPWYGAEEFINKSPRYCLWLGDCLPEQLQQMPLCMKRIENVARYRLASKSAPTRKLAQKPTRFHVENMPDSTFLVIPIVSSERREYIPMGFMSPDCLCSNLVFISANANLFHFGIMTSSIHMAWIKVVCGRLKSDYRYSGKIVYNNFPWPAGVTEKAKEAIEKGAQRILEVRDKYADSTYAQLYNPLTMPADLVDAHRANDKTVFAAYSYLGLRPEMTDEDIALILLRESVRLDDLSKKKKKTAKRKTRR